jgi:murein DD-endopeptidase MepM/ murein hydrolase activator NlpD
MTGRPTGGQSVRGFTRLHAQGDGELEHGKRATHRHRAEIDRIDLGNEPPLSVDGGTGVTIDRRRVSAQWFSGTILTGLCGAALMGGAVFTSLDGEAHFASLPERMDNVLRGAIGDRTSGPRKSDRLPPAGELNGARQIIRESMVSRVGSREIVRVRPFVRVSSNLALSLSDLSANIPPFNPQKLLADTGADTATLSSDNASAAEPDAEVSFVQRDITTVLARAKLAGSLPMEEVLASVREAANWSARDNTRYAVAGLNTRTLAYAADGNPDPYAGFEARIVPENITLLPKTAAQITGGNTSTERTVTVKKGDSIGSILRELGALPDEIRAIAAALGARGRENGLKEGLRLRILLSGIPGSPRQQPARVIVSNEAAVEAVIALSDLGRYVSVDVNVINNSSLADARDDEEEDDGTGVRLYQSIYETALRNQIPRSVIDELIRVYSYDVDFQRKVQPGDSFEVLFATEDDTITPDGRNGVQFAALTLGGEQKKFYRFQTPDDNTVDYYDETGKSAKKFLVRKPLPDGIMRSSFGVRRHPMLGYMKMHTGVDWAAPHGTPIYAAGNGIVERVGWEGGYGKYIRVKHNNGYETAYGHMTAYARGIDPGVRVTQGQVIGFVGSTGLSTGAHVHYEIMVNGRFVDPMRIRLPRGRVLENAILAGFEAERDRLDGMMARAGPRMAQSTAR